MRRKGIYACPHCGGRSIDPLQLVSGPMATVDDWDGSYRCLECGKVAVPLFFREAEEWVLFRQERSKAVTPSAEEEGFSHIPIVPVDTRPLLSQTGFDVPFIKVVDVVTVEWDRGLRRTAYSARFDRYWAAISGTRYGSKQIMMMDLAGICEHRPNYKAMRDLVRSKYEVWLDLGIASEHDLFDAFSLEAYRAVAATSTAPSLRLFEELFAISDRCVPCVQFSGEVVWGGPERRLRRLEDALDAILAIGFGEIAVIDLDALGRKRGVSEELVSRLQGFPARLFVGGGVVESDLEGLRKAGMAGGLLEPFTPVISDILAKGEDATVADAPVDAPVPRRAPKYLATD